MIKVKSKITDRDMGIKRIRSELKKAKNSFVTIGIHKNKTYSNGTPITLVAAVHEFGTDHAGKNRNTVIPERSFLRSTFDEKKDYLFNLIKSLYTKITTGTTDVKTALNTIGFQHSQQIQGKIEDIKEPPNKESTVKRKPSIGNNPLIHKRKLKGAVDYEVTLK